MSKLLPTRWQLAHAMYVGPDRAIMSRKGPCALIIERTKHGYYVTAIDDTRNRKTMSIDKLLDAINGNGFEYDWISASVFVSNKDVEEKNEIAQFLIEAGLTDQLGVGQRATATNGSLAQEDVDD